VPQLTLGLGLAGGAPVVPMRPQRALNLVELHRLGRPAAAAARPLSGGLPISAEIPMTPGLSFQAAGRPRGAAISPTFGREKSCLRAPVDRHASNFRHTAPWHGFILMPLGSASTRARSMPWSWPRSSRPLNPRRVRI